MANTVISINGKSVSITGESTAAKLNILEKELAVTNDSIAANINDTVSTVMVQNESKIAAIVPESTLSIGEPEKCLIVSPIGARGLPGDAAGGFSLPSQIAIGGNRAIATSGGYAVYASNDDETLVTVGISKAAAEPNSSVQLQTTGKMLVSSAGFTAGLPVFVGTNGTLTQNISGAKFAQRVGIAHSPEILLIDISQPIFTGE